MTARTRTFKGRLAGLLDIWWFILWKIEIEIEIDVDVDIDIKIDIEIDIDF